MKKEKSITLASYNGAQNVIFGGTEYPMSAVTGFRLDEQGKISWISMDSNMYSEWLNQLPPNSACTRPPNIFRQIKKFFGG